MHCSKLEKMYGLFHNRRPPLRKLLNKKTVTVEDVRQLRDDVCSLNGAAWMGSPKRVHVILLYCCSTHPIHSASEDEEAGIIDGSLYFPFCVSNFLKQMILCFSC